MHNLGKQFDAKLLTADGSLYALTAGTDGSFSNGTEIDMGQYKNICFIVALGAVSASGVITLRAKATDTSTSYGSGTIDRIGSDLTNSAAAAGSNKCLVMDFHNIKRRYARLSLQRTGGNVVVLSVTAIRYNGPQAPVLDTSYDNFAQYSEPVPSTT